MRSVAALSADIAEPIRRFRTHGPSIGMSNPTCCCFGGKDFDVLYISTARQRLTPEQLAREPLAGGLFAARPGVRGLPEARFAA